MRVVVTGHRPKKLPGGYAWAHPDNIRIMDWISSVLNELKFKKTLTDSIMAGTGMAIGVDQMFAAQCKEHHIPFIAFVPCVEQDKMWPQSSKDLYKNILDSAAQTIMVTNEPYTHGCMQTRNLAMRDWAKKDMRNLLLAVWDGTPGGTGNMVKACEGEMSIRRFDPRKGEV